MGLFKDCSQDCKCHELPHLMAMAMALASQAGRQSAVPVQFSTVQQTTGKKFTLYIFGSWPPESVAPLGDSAGSGASPG